MPSLGIWWAHPTFPHGRSSLPSTSQSTQRLEYCYLLLTLCRQPNEDTFAFHQNIPSRRPRGWERAPKSPQAARHKGRKVWKRPEARPKDALGQPHTGTNNGDDIHPRSPLGQMSTNTPRPVKRLRLKNAPDFKGDTKDQKAARYFPTLHNGNAGTPKSCLPLHSLLQE